MGPPLRIGWLVKGGYKAFVSKLTLLRGLTITMGMNHLKVLGWSSQSAVPEASLLYPGSCVSWCFKIHQKNIWGVASAKKVSLNLRGESFNKRLGLSECFLKSDIFDRNFPSKPLRCLGKAAKKIVLWRKIPLKSTIKTCEKETHYKNHHQLSLSSNSPWIFWDGKFRMS